MTDLATETTSPAEEAAAADAPAPEAEAAPESAQASADAAAEAEAIANGDQVKVVPADSNGSSDPQPSAAQVKGRIEIEDEVVEKVAALSAIEVDGVADLGGDIERAVESVRERIGIGRKRGDQGVTAEIRGREVSITLQVVIEYGHVVMEVAREVKANVARSTNRMLGLRVVEVNVTVDDVVMPEKFNHSTQAQQRAQQKLDRGREEQERYLPIE
ncbi:MAG TPA: Asp23/Gls24 family envelope stress response protein [Streptosporangiaceae bacterium]|jgi:uncharacterized alkaline shock family protein YloU